MEEFKDKVAIVTGGGMGLGQALCEEMASRGAIVVVADVNEEAAHRVANRLADNGLQASAMPTDVSCETDVSRLIDATVARFGRLDYIFNNAAVVIGGDARDLSPQQWDRVVEVNLHGVIYGTINAYKVMARQGYGHIVNISSASGLVPQPGNTPYCTCKHGIIGLSLSMRFEGVDLGVKVSAVCPGDMKTSIYENMIVMNGSRDEVVKISRRSHFLIPQMTAQEAARTILKGVVRNRALIVFPGAVRLIWRLYRLFPALVYRISVYRMRMFRRVLRPAPATSMSAP
jgi:NAD(P)-dependent dehydrogenase (short-subunit alcohol dehydrogenase family)